MKQQRPIEMVDCARCNKAIPRHESFVWKPAGGNSDFRMCRPCVDHLTTPPRPEPGEGV